MANFLSCWGNHNMGNHCRYCRKVLFCNSQKSRGTENPSKMKKGEKRKKGDKIPYLLLSSLALWVNLCQMWLKKISILSYTRMKQITAWDFIFFPEWGISLSSVKTHMVTLRVFRFFVLFFFFFQCKVRIFLQNHIGTTRTDLLFSVCLSAVPHRA